MDIRSYSFRLWSYFFYIFCFFPSWPFVFPIMAIWESLYELFFAIVAIIWIPFPWLCSHRFFSFHFCSHVFSVSFTVSIKIKKNYQHQWKSSWPFETNTLISYCFCYVRIRFRFQFLYRHRDWWHLINFWYLCFFALSILFIPYFLSYQTKSGWYFSQWILWDVKINLIIFECRQMWNEDDDIRTKKS